MRPLGNPLTHLRLVRGMAKATRTDIVKAYEDGRLDAETWASMVERCRSCTSAGPCKAWLHEGPEWQDAPGVCLNREVFAQLKRDAQDPSR